MTTEQHAVAGFPKPNVAGPTPSAPEPLPPSLPLSPHLPLSRSPALPLPIALRLLLTAALVLVVCLREPAGIEAYRTRQATGPLAFRLLNWEVEQVLGRLGGLVRALRGELPAADVADVASVREFFRAPPADRAGRRREAEAAIQRLVTDGWRAEGLTVESPLADGRPTIFPPVSFTFTSPPQVLIVSPRERIEVADYALLRPSLDAVDVARLEDGVASRGVSTLVTPIGGLATYPAMVLEAGSAEATLSAVAHEWVHGYFFFRPLGRGYWADQDVRTINETAAELAGNELGTRLARRLELAAPPPNGPPAAPSPRLAEVNALLRQTRLEVDRLLASGQVEAAEGYMEQHRLEINARGFGLRRLNQAYFAFHGSYAEGPAGSSPLAGQIRRLRNRSASLGEFLKAVAEVSGTDDLARISSASFSPSSSSSPSIS